ncbi:MAG: Gfo/Idh/MocA family protein [Steroidobacteraceae bacterium]
MNRPQVLRWGVLGAAQIALRQVLPAFSVAAHAQVTAIAARDPERARAVAHDFRIAKVFSGYAALLADPQIDAVYIPLPNDLHVSWTVQALEAGKHVLCEKPLALNVADAERVAEAVHRTGRHVAEAYMIRFHPQWRCAVQIVRAGELGELRALQCWFAYDNPAGENLRNSPAHGGGALYDVGGYALMAGRLLFGSDPGRVIGLFSRPSEAAVDALTSGLMDFPGGAHLQFGVSTCLSRLQSVVAYGTRGRMHIEAPFNPTPSLPTRLRIDDGRDLYGGGMRTVLIPAANQYAEQLDTFSRAVLRGDPPPYGIEDALVNARVLDALFRSEHSGKWEIPGERTTGF